MLKVEEEMVIAAPAETVFKTITALEAYREWNPWIIEAEGTPQEGQLVRVISQLGKKKMQVYHRILTHKPYTEFRWCDTGWFTVFAYGQRARFLETLPQGGVRYRVELTITGIFSWLVKWLFGKSLASGLKAETEALKKRAESRG